MRNLKLLSFLGIFLCYQGNLSASFLAYMNRVDFVDIKPVSTNGYQGNDIVKVLVLYAPSEMKAPQLQLKRDLSLFFNRPFERSNENRAEYILDLPFGSETSIYQYYKEQSGGKLSVLTSITSDKIDFVENRGDYDILVMVTDSYFMACKSNGALLLVEHSDSSSTAIRDLFQAEGVNYTQGSLSNLGEPYAWDVTRAVAMLALNVPKIYQMDMREKLLSFGLMVSPYIHGGEQFRLYRKLRVHPPNMIPYVRWKLGWVQMQPLSHMSMVRIGLMHEGDVIYKYEPNNFKVSDSLRDQLGIANYPEAMAGWQSNIDGDGNDQGGHDFLLLENRQDLGYEGGEVDLPSTTRGILDPGKLLAGNTVAPAEGIVIYEMSVSKSDIGSLGSRVYKSSLPTEVVDAHAGALISALNKYFADLVGRDLFDTINPLYTSSQLKVNYADYFYQKDEPAPDPLPACLDTYYPQTLTWEYVEHVLNPYESQLIGDDEGDSEEKLRFGLIDPRGLGGDIGRDDDDFYPQMVDAPGFPQSPWRGDQRGDDAGFDAEHYPFISSRNSDYTAGYDDVSGPVSEFGGYFYYVINSFDYLTSKSTYVVKDDIGQAIDFTDSQLDFFTPTFSNISQLNRLMTAEVCSSDFYYNGTHGKQLGENGFITRRFPNKLGISLKEDRYDKDRKLIGYGDVSTQTNVPGIPLSELQYEYWLNQDLNLPTYRSYSIELQMDYLQTQKDLTFGVWNKGGQHLPYKVIWGDDQENGLFLPLKNPPLELDLVGNKSAVYRTRLNMDYIRVLAGQMDAVNNPRYVKRIKLATVAWRPIFPGETESDGYGTTYDIYVNIVMNAPAEMDFFGMPKGSEPGSPVSLVLPIYAKGANGRAVLANKRRQSETLVGKSMLKGYVKSNKTWLIPREVAGEAAEFYVVPGGFSEIPVAVVTSDYLDAGEKLNTTLSDAELIATTTTVGVDLPNDSIMRVPVKIQVQNMKPSDPIVQKTSSPGFNIYFGYDKDENQIPKDKFIEVNSSYFYVEWNPVRNTRFALVYAAGESTTGLANDDWQNITGVVDSYDDCIVDYQVNSLKDSLVYSDKILDLFPEFAIDLTKHERLATSIIRFPDTTLNRQSVFGLKTIAINNQELEHRFDSFSGYGIIAFNQSDEKNALMYLMNNKQNLVSDPNASLDAIDSINLLTKIVSNIYSVFDFIDPVDTYGGKSGLINAILASVNEIKTTGDFVLMGDNFGLFETYDQLEKTWQIAALSGNEHKLKCFLSDDMSQPFGAIRRQIGAPTDLTASSEKEQFVYLEWTAQKPIDGIIHDVTVYKEIDLDDFSIWRSSTRGFDDAIELTTGVVNLENGSDDDLYASFSYSDRTALPYPRTYYYWIKRDEGTLEPGYDNPDLGLSNRANGGLREPFDGWLPIVEFVADDFEQSEGVNRIDPVLTRGESSFDPTSSEFVLSAGPVLDGLTTNIRFSATVSLDVDLTNNVSKDIQMNFDYKFQNLNDRSYLVVLVNGKQVYTVKANQSTGDWANTDYVDITEEAAGKKVKIVIGLISDSLLLATEGTDDQQLRLRAIQVGERIYGPRWELLSVPTDGSISRILPNSITSGSFLYNWNYASAKYDDPSLATQKFLEAGMGYWIKSPKPLTSAIKVLSHLETISNDVKVSKLAKVKTGWNLVGPIKKTLLRPGILSGLSSVAYLNDYLGTSFVTGTDEEPVLDCQIWYWNPQVKQYQPVKDELNIGEAYWIFKF